MKALICGLAVSLLMPVLAAAQTPDAESAAYLSARQASRAARQGNSQAIQQAFDQFEKLSQAHPEQPLYRAYYGSMYGIKARAAWFPFTKLAYVESGLDQIGKALAALTPEHDRQQIAGIPVSLETRLVAAGTLAGVPGVFGRSQQARDVTADLLASPVLNSAPPGFRAAVYLHAARMAEKDGAAEQARENWRKALEIAPDSDAGKQARELLEKAKA